MTMLNTLFKDLILLSLALTIATYLIGAFNIDPQVQSPTVTLSTWQGWFSINLYSGLFGAGAAVIGLASLLTRSGTYAIYATLLAALGMIIKPIQDIVLAIPNFIALLLPKETNPLAYTNGVYDPSYSGINPIIAVVTLIYGFAAFWFLFSILTQRDI